MPVPFKLLSRLEIFVDTNQAASYIESY